MPNTKRGYMFSKFDRQQSDELRLIGSSAGEMIYYSTTSRQTPSPLPSKSHTFPLTEGTSYQTHHGSATLAEASPYRKHGSQYLDKNVPPLAVGPMVLRQHPSLLDDGSHRKYGSPATLAVEPTMTSQEHGSPLLSKGISPLAVGPMALSKHGKTPGNFVTESSGHRTYHAIIPSLHIPNPTSHTKVRRLRNGCVPLIGVELEEVLLTELRSRSPDGKISGTLPGMRKGSGYQPLCSPIPSSGAGTPTHGRQSVSTTSVFSSDQPDSSDSWEENGSELDFKVFNVSGTYFMIDTGIFSQYPDTLLGSTRLQDYYRPSRDEYFLEQNKYVFPAVLRFYTHNEELNCPPCLPKDTFEDCLEFYGLLPYYQGLKSVVNGGPNDLNPKNWKEKLSFTLQFPYYSTTAKVYAVFDIMVIVLSTITLVLESIPELTKLKNFNTVAQSVEACVNVYFTIQAITLLLVYSSWKEYFKTVLHWIDIVSILPFYLRLVAGSYFTQVGGFRVLRLIRLLRVMKLFRHSKGSQTMMTFLFASLPEIMLLLLMWSIGVLLFGPLIFFIEGGHGANSTSDFDSAFSGMWFCVVTIGTVGYGDLSPASNLGKFVSALYTILNLTIMTIPISIIITKFSRSMRLVKK